MEREPLVVSVVIPCRDERDHIEACLRSILAQAPSTGGFEVVVADGMSGDGTREILEQMVGDDPRLRVIDNPGRIVSTGLNAAIRVAQGSIIIRMDVHTEYASDYISQCLAVLRETGADNVGGPWVAKGKGLVGRAIAAAFQSSFAAGDSHGHNASYEGPLDTVYLGCWPREVFDKAGFFDEELVRNQDDEFNLRLVRAGGKIWQSPRIRSWYRPRESLRALFLQYMQYGYWKVRVIQKHRMPTSVRHLIPASFVLLLVVLPLVSLVWPSALLGWLALVGAYTACSIATSFRIAARQGWRLLPILPLVFACYHFAYGYGFLRGLWDFVIWRRGAHRSYGKLTRA
jgi:glycosyltransferase involved in cell wall biosynthesis